MWLSDESFQLYGFAASVGLVAIVLGLAIVLLRKRSRHRTADQQQSDAGHPLNSRSQPTLAERRSQDAARRMVEQLRDNS